MTFYDLFKYTLYRVVTDLQNIDMSIWNCYGSIIGKIMGKKKILFPLFTNYDNKEKKSESYKNITSPEVF